MTSFERITKQRLEKLAKLRAAGIVPYPNSFQRSHTTQEAVALLKKHEEATGAVSTQSPADGNPSVTVAGRVMARRKMGKISFMDLRDGSGKIQLLLGDLLTAQQNDLLKEIDIGDILGVTGRLFRTKTSEPTIAVADFTLLSKSLQPLPEKWHGLVDVEARYRQRYLDLISNPEVHQTFKARSQIIAAMRQFLNEKGFLEVETPVLQPSAGGALANPFITHHNALDQDFFLHIATELHLKRLIVGGFDKVYEIGRIFRNEGISTTHSPEFTMLESYEAYADYKDVMAMLEQMIYQISQRVLGTAEIKYGNDVIDLTPPWKRMTLREAAIEFSGIDFVKYPSADDLRVKMGSLGMKLDPEFNWAKLVDELLKTFIRPKLIQPTIVYDYPVSMSPLAKAKPGEERVVERFQAYAGGSIELGNAYSELNDPIEQRERFVAQQHERHGADEEKWSIDEDFLQALEYGMPPTGGLGVGIDRLVMLLTNQQSIREVILFPQLRGKG
ncbi:MAG: lysine--tRNA ligase [Chloroflexi bacterium RBG_16_51_9]|nr:MAG: lysine--tRNA ligase [Chloroflexi bacterium RBG_16_51_9]HLB28298.1 lysine--tRNA ligase [Dehalococcoidales bacterium]